MSREKVNLKYYIFDWDDNILHMSTKIIMEKLNKGNWELVDVPTSDFTEARQDTENYRIPLKDDSTPNFDLAFENFRDNGQKGEDAFVHDMIEAIDNESFGVSYKAFKKCLINGSLFVCLTARGHEPESIKRGIMYFIETQLSNDEKQIMKNNLRSYCEAFNVNVADEELLSNYMSLCEYIGVSSDYFKELVIKERLSDENNFDPTNTELSKKIASKYIVEKLHEYKKDDTYNIKIGFSDDDKGNVDSVVGIFKEMKENYNNTKFFVYDTSKNKDGSINYDKIVI